MARTFTEGFRSRTDTVYVFPLPLPFTVMPPPPFPQITGHPKLLHSNPTLRKLLNMRNPYIDPINVLQTEILKRLRKDPNNNKLRDALLISINGEGKQSKLVLWWQSVPYFMIETVRNDPLNV